MLPNGIILSAISLHTVFSHIKNKAGECSCFVVDEIWFFPGLRLGKNSSQSASVPKGRAQQTATHFAEPSEAGL
jgi:hypothetical protein